MVTLLLPGMDGTGRLFDRLLPLLDPAIGARAVSFPPDRPLGYEQLLAELEIPRGPFAIVAESFSGPLGVLLAARYSDRVRGLVLVAAFVRSPSRLARAAASMGPSLLRIGLPDLALRSVLLGRDAGDAELGDVRAAIDSVSAPVLAHRLREIAMADVTTEFASISVPTLYLAGGRDRLVGVKIMEQLRRLRPAMQSHVLDAPHLVLQRAPTEAARVISQFLAPLLAT
jgi:pimeloyl-ACP methyl ester carboxylesterase